MGLFGPPNIEKLKARGDVPLKKATLHKDPQVRVAAARALGEVGGSAAVDALIHASYDRSAEVACAVATALGVIGDGRAAPALTALIEREDALAISWAAEALGPGVGIGTMTKDRFIEGVHKERGVRQAAMDALGKIEAGPAT
jgi:HEAT repeat protein